MGTSYKRTAAQKAAVARRMKTIWAKRRAAMLGKLAGPTTEGMGRQRAVTVGENVVVELNYTRKEAAPVLAVAAAPGGLDQDQQDIWNEFEQMKIQTIKKNMDYGSSVFTEPVLAPGLGKTAAIQVRMSDKINRLGTLLQAGAAAPVVDESVMDTMGDLGVYALLWRIGRRREQAAGKLRADYEVFMAKENAKEKKA